jgi:hypothetical protein
MAAAVRRTKRFLVWLTGLICAFIFGQGSEALGVRIQGEGKIKPSSPTQEKPQVEKLKPPPKQPVPVKYGPPPIKPSKPETPPIVIKYGIAPSGMPPQGPKK